MISVPATKTTRQNNVETCSIVIQKITAIHEYNPICSSGSKEGSSEKFDRWMMRHSYLWSESLEKSG